MFLSSTPTGTRALAVLLTATAAAPGQTILRQYHDLDGGPYGLTVAGGEDFDQDGFSDVVIGDYAAFSGFSFTGRAEAISGRDGSVLHTWYGQDHFGQFGHAVALCGDVDGDGAQDVIVGAPTHFAFPVGDAGMAQVFSGRTGLRLHTVWGETVDEQFGYAVAGGLDHDGDGLAEFAVGAIGVPGPGGTGGVVRLFDGATGAELARFSASAPDEQFGWALSAAGDVDGDGVDDLVIGAPDGAGSQGRIEVHSGATLQLLWESSGSVGSSRFGHSLATGLDVDLDGRSEVLVGAPHGSLGWQYGGFAALLDGAGGAQLRSWSGTQTGARLGHSVAVLDDLDGDGVPDCAISAPLDLLRRISVRSGADDTELLALQNGESGDWFGADVSAGGDVNGDGAPDLIVGMPFADTPTVQVLSGAGPGIATYCTAGTSASGCRASIAASGVPSASAPSGFVLSVTGVEGGRRGALLLGNGERQALPWGSSSSYLCIGGAPQLTGPGSSGGTRGACDGSLALDANPLGFGAGEIVRAQLWYRDPSSSSGTTTAFSDAIELVVQP